MSSINKVVVKGVSYAIEDSEAREKVGKAIVWNSTQHLDSYKTAGVYLIDGKHLASDGFPINNTGTISARLTVLVTYSDDVSNVVITQVLNLNNNGGGEGNIYIRSYQNGVWKPWGKLQTNVEVNAIGLGQEKTFDDLTDNGIYSGVNVYSVGTDNNGYPITAYETFVLVVINAYLTGGGISQLKYSLKENKSFVETRTRTSGWSEWSKLEGNAEEVDLSGVYDLINAEIDRATIAENSLNGAITRVNDTAARVDGNAFSATADEVKLTTTGVNTTKQYTVVLPVATTENAGVMTAEDKGKLDKLTSQKVYLTMDAYKELEKNGQIQDDVEYNIYEG